MTFNPVCNGTVTGARSMIAVAGRSIGRRFGPGDRASAVEGPAERIDDSPNQRVADNDIHNAAGAPYFIAGAELVVIAEQHDADFVFIDIESDAKDPAGKAEQFLGAGAE